MSALAVRNHSECGWHRSRETLDSRCTQAGDNVHTQSRAVQLTTESSRPLVARCVVVSASPAKQVMCTLQSTSNSCCGGACRLYPLALAGGWHRLQGCWWLLRHSHRGPLRRADLRVGTLSLDDGDAWFPADESLVQEVHTWVRMVRHERVCAVKSALSTVPASTRSNAVSTLVVSRADVSMYAML